MKKITLIMATLFVVFQVSSVSAGPAPALTSQQVAAVGSSNAPITFSGNNPSAYDIVAESDFTSKLDYKGPTTVQVLVLERGYANNTRIASLDGRKPSRITTYPVVNTSRTVVGYFVLYEFFNVNPINYARFTSSASSLVFPFKTFSDTILVK